MKHNTLHQILSLQFASVNNLFSYEAKSYKGALLQVDIDIKRYLKAGWISKVPFDLKPRNKRQQYFYFATRKGAKAIDRLEDFKQKITKSLNNAEHESMKIDVARAFLINYPDYEFTFDYKKEFNKLRPDIFIKAKSPEGREYTFLVEVERKKELTRIINDKIKNYNKHIANGDFNSLYKPKILFVCADLQYDAYLRPQQYPDNQAQLNKLNKHYADFLSKIKNLPDKHYRFITFPEFTKIADQNWRIPSGTKVRIME